MFLSVVRRPFSFMLWYIFLQHHVEQPLPLQNDQKLVAYPASRIGKEDCISYHLHAYASGFECGVFPSNTRIKLGPTKGSRIFLSLSLLGLLAKIKSVVSVLSSLISRTQSNGLQWDYPDFCQAEGRLRPASPLPRVDLVLQYLEEQPSNPNKKIHTSENFIQSAWTVKIQVRLSAGCVWVHCRRSLSCREFVLLIVHGNWKSRLPTRIEISSYQRKSDPDYEAG